MLQFVCQLHTTLQKSFMCCQLSVLKLCRIMWININYMHESIPIVKFTELLPLGVYVTSVCDQGVQC